MTEPTLAEEAKLTASDLRSAIAERYEAPEWHLEMEVTLEGRRLDVLAFNLWGARSYRVVGFEIKAARGDWLKELSQFQKAAQWTAVCDEFYVVTPPKLVKPYEVPLEWGHLELCGARMMTRKYPTRREPGTTLPREVAARFFTRITKSLRERDRGDEARLRYEVRQQIEADVTKHIEARRASDLTYLREQNEKYKALQETLGLNGYEDPSTILSLARLIHEAGIDRPYFKARIERIASDMEEAAKPLRALSALFESD